MAAQRHAERAQHILAEAARAALAAFLPAAQPERDERGIERAFGQQAAEQVRDLQRDEECVGQRAGAEHRRDHDVAHEAEQRATATSRRRRS